MPVKKQMPVNAPAWVLETAQLRGDFLVWSGTSESQRWITIFIICLCLFVCAPPEWRILIKQNVEYVWIKIVMLLKDYV